MLSSILQLDTPLPPEKVKFLRAQLDSATPMAFDIVSRVCTEYEDYDRDDLDDEEYWSYNFILICLYLESIGE